MNGFSSNMGVSFNTAAVAVKGGTGILTTYIPPSYDEYAQIDYSDPVVTSNSSNTNANSTFLIDKGINTAGWASTKWVIGEIATLLPKTTFGTITSIVVVALSEGAYKGFLKGLSSGLDSNIKNPGFLATSAGGFTKAGLTGVGKIFKDATVKALQAAYEKIPTLKITAASLDKLADKFPDLFNDGDVNIWNRKFYKNKSPSNAFKFATTPTLTSLSALASEFTFTLGLDFFTGILANGAVGLLDGDKLTLDEFKLGNTFLKSSTKIIWATAGEIAFGKIGKVVGTTIGSYLGELQVNAMTETENLSAGGWCAIAGGAQIAGAGIAVAVLFTFCASNPVGWVVGAVIIAGAAIGFAVTWVTHLIVDSVQKNRVEGVT